MRISSCFFMLAFMAGFASELLAENSPWPRTILGEYGGKVTLYQPQVDQWDSYTTLEFRLAAVFELPGMEQPTPSAVRAKAVTSVNVPERLVVASEIEVLEVNIPSEDEALVERLKTAANENLSGTTHSFSLDEVLAHFATAKARADAFDGPEIRAATPDDADDADDYRGEPPKIHSSDAPAVLVLFDGDPIFVKLEGVSGLDFAVNTNWDLFLHADSSTYYLRHETTWLQSKNLVGPWNASGGLPDVFSQIPDLESFESVRSHVPGEPIDEDAVPRVFISFEPAELIVVDGYPEEESVPGTELMWVTNTDSVLFRASSNGEFLYLVSGRWFQAASLEGPWVRADEELIWELSQIPDDHPAAAVRASIAGTREAEEAVMLATIPSKVTVQREAATVEVRYHGDPEFREIADTDVYFAVNTHSDVFRVGRSYYACYQGVWFVSSAAEGPWLVSDSVPSEIYEIPPENPKYNVTYVRVYDSTPDTVVVGYSAGYHGIYVSGSTVVYGTGYYYSPYVYYTTYGYPVYYGYPYSYGVAAYYNPYTATYGRGSSLYGPYGGAGWGAAYNPATGTYARGVSAWGPYSSGYARQAHNPRTDSYAASYERGNSYASWGESVVSRGDKWAHTRYYSDDRGTLRAAETSSGAGAAGVKSDSATAYVGRDAENNVYAGSDGNVYRRDESGWSSYTAGDWQPVEPTEPPRDLFSLSSDTRTPSSLDGAADSWRETGKSRSRMSELEHDWQARSSGFERSRQFDAWQRDRSRFQTRSLGGSLRGRRGR